MSSAVLAAGALKGRRALITGGGTNLGRAAAAELAAAGATVVICGRRQEVLEQTAGELGCDFLVGDIRTDGPALVAEMRARCGGVDLLLNNAGGQYFVPAEGITAKGWRAVQQLNLEGTWAMSKAAVEQCMGAAGAGTILNVTVSPHHGMPAMAHTGAARAAVEQMSRSLAQAWAPVSVVALAIGRFDTESLRKYPEAVLAGAARSVPLGRLGQLEEYAWLVALLALPGMAAAMSGSVVTLDGGADNWWGPWPPSGLASDAGDVPTEARR